MDAYRWAQARRRIDAARRLLIIVAAIAAAVPSATRASEVKIPLTIDYVAVTEALRADLYTAPGGRALLWNGSDTCQHLWAEEPKFSRAGVRVRLETNGNLALGVNVAGACVSAMGWDGIVETESSPYIAPPLQIRLHIEEINLYNAEHEKTLLVGRGFDLIKDHFIPRLQTFSYDLAPAVRQLTELAEGASTPEVATRIHTAMATLRAEPQVEAMDRGVRVTVVITVPDLPRPEMPAMNAEPTQEELAAFENQLDQWDAFLVFAIKRLGETDLDNQFRDQLVKILLDSRYRLLYALRRPPSASGPDPVRALFLDTWKQLGEAVRQAAERGSLGAHALEFLSFISAGDALFALDQAAPALGMRISANDLRRLARIMAPNAPGDPLRFNYDEDKELRKMFNGARPLEGAGPLEMPGPIGESEAPPSGPASPASPRPVQSPSAAPTSSHAPPPVSGMLLKFMFAVVEPPDAAAEEMDLKTRLLDTAQRLWRRIVDDQNVTDYREDMNRLLELSAEREFAASKLDPRWHDTYLLLVKSTAWQESCWRQFVEVNGHIRWLESTTGDIGLMQVNKHVWRGLYRLPRLEWDVLYNAGAGTEILMWGVHYVIARPKIDPVPVEDHLARSVYAVYNGGPRAYNRWRLWTESAIAKQVDDQFFAKYQDVKDGRLIDILNCGIWARSRVILDPPTDSTTSSATMVATCSRSARPRSR